MATGSGPCRFGQYYIFMEDLIQRLGIPDVAMLSLSSENAYLGLHKLSTGQPGGPSLYRT